MGDWAGPVPLSCRRTGSTTLWLFSDEHGDVVPAGGRFIAWQQGVDEWGSGQLATAADAWVLPLEDAWQFGWMLVRLAGRAVSYDPDDLAAGRWRMDWVGPDPLESGRYPLLGGRQGLLTGCLFFDPDGDLAPAGTFFVAVAAGIEEWDNGHLLQAAAAGGVLILPLDTAADFGRALAELAGRPPAYDQPADQ